MFEFEWDVFVTPDLLRRVARAGSVEGARGVNSLRAVVATILSRVGGVPFTDRELPLQERTRRAAWMLEEAVAHTLARVSAFRKPARLVGKPSKVAEYKEELTLAATPGASLPDRLREHWQPTGELEHDLGWLARLHTGTDALERLRGALSLVAEECASVPHPAAARFALRGAAPAKPDVAFGSDWTAMLAGVEYHRCVPTLLASAKESVDVLMFHIACPTAKHPTRLLLDALVSAHEKGVGVRVLMDRDRATDPYNSNVINAPAHRFLSGKGVECRLDASDKLMHSKLVIIDGALVIIGSHNWTAGSYFDFDDVSIATRSRKYGAHVSRRFESLWKSAGTA